MTRSDQPLAEVRHVTARGDHRAALAYLWSIIHSQPRGSTTHGESL
jgi:hypothetical protein